MLGKSKKYISLKEAARISGYASDYIGSLIRKGKIKGKRVYLNTSWEVLPSEIIKHRKKNNNLGGRDKFLLRQRYLSLKEAAELSDYAPDYIGQLIRAGKIKGKKVYSGTVWLVEEGSLSVYLGKINSSLVFEAFEKKQPQKITQEIGLVHDVFYPDAFEKAVRKITGWRPYKTKAEKIFNFGYRFILVAAVFLLLIGVGPVEIFQRIAEAFGEEEKTTSFYPTNCYGGWENSQSAQGQPENGKELNETNSAVLRNSISPIFCEGFGGEIPENAEMKKVSLKFSWAFKDETIEFVIPATTGNNNETGETLPDQEAINNESIETINEPGTEDGDKSVPPPEAPPVPIPAPVPESIIETAPAESSFFEKIISSVFAQEEEQSIPEDVPLVDLTEDSLLPTEETGVDEVESEENVKREQIPDTEDITADETVVDQPDSVETDLQEPGTAEEPEVSKTELDLGGADLASDAFLEVFYTTDNNFDNSGLSNEPRWQSLGRVGESNWEGLVLDVPISDLDEVENLQIKIDGLMSFDDKPTVYLDSVWLEVEYEEVLEEITLTPEEIAQLPRIKIEKEIFFKDSKEDFQLNEKPEFEINISYLETEYSKTAEPELIPSVKIMSVPEEIVSPDSNQEESVLTPSSLEEETDLVLEQVISPPVEPETATENAESDSTSTDSEQANPPQAEPENTEENIEPTSFLNIIHGLFGLKGASAKTSKTKILKVTILDPIGIENANFYDIKKVKDETKVQVKKPANDFRPGKYKISVEILIGENIFYSEEEFTWGVLAINIDRSIELPGEDAFLQFGVLDDKGYTICNADLDLLIKSPSGNTFEFNTKDGSIIKEEQCGPNNFILTPDYYAHFSVPDEIGFYEMVLTANTENGEHTITDAFEVRDSVVFDVIRSGPTRINPTYQYPVTLEITPEADWQGIIKETVPENFEITPPVHSIPYDNIEIIGEEKIISWNVSLRAGEESIIGYYFDAPDVSPEFYLLGPLSFPAQGGPASGWKEVRQWQIASDVDSNCISAGDGNWTAITWTNCGSNPGGDPDSDDSVTIANGHDVILNTDTTIANLTINTTSTATSLVHAANADLIVTGSVNIIQGTGAGDNGLWDVAADTGTVSGTITLTQNNTNTNRDAILRVSTGTLNANGGITCTGTTAGAKTVDITGAGTIKMKGTLTGNAGCTLAQAATGIWSYSDNTAAQTTDISWGSGNHSNLYLNNTHADGVTLDAAITSSNVTADLIVQTGTFKNGGFAIAGGSGDTFQVDSGATFVMTGGTTAVFPTVFTISLNAASTVKYQQDSDQTISAQTYGNLELSPTITAARIYTGTAFTVNGDFTINPGTAANLLTVNMGGNVTVAATKTTTITRTTSATSLLDLDPGTDYNLTTGFLNIATGGTLDATSSASIITLTGTSGTLFTRSGTFTQGSSDVQVTSASGTPTLLSAATTFYRLTINASGATVINMGAFTPTIAASGTLYVQSGVFNASGADVTGPGGTGTLQIDNGATLCLGGTTVSLSATCNDITSSDTTARIMPTFQTYTFGATSTVSYLSDAATTVSQTPTYGNLTLNPVFDATSRIYTLGGVMTINGDFTINPNETGASTPALTVNAGGDITVATGKTTNITRTNSATSSLDLRPSATDWDLSTGALSIGAGGTLDAGGSESIITLKNTSAVLLSNLGTFTQGTSDVQVTSASGTPLLLLGATTFHKLTINSAATVINMGDATTINNVAGAQLYVQSGVFNASGVDITGPGAGNGTLRVDNGATLCLGGTITATNNTCNSGASDTTTRSMPTFQTYTFGATSTISYLSDAATTVSETPAYGNLTLNPVFVTTSRIYTLNGVMTINGDFTINPDESGAGTPALTVNPSGHITVASGKTTTITRTNSATATLDLDPGSDYNLTTGVLTIQAGGTLDATSSASAINLSGNYTNNGTFTAGSSTVTLNGSSTQALSGTMTSGSAFYNLIITNNSGASASDCERTSFTASVDFAASATITNNYNIATSNVRVEYNSTSTYTVTNLSWEGADSNLIYFRNSVAGSGSWLLNVSGTQGDGVSYVNVSRSDASGGNEIDADDGTNVDACDPTNNVNWNFAEEPSISFSISANILNLGNLNTSSVNTSSHDVTVTTNAPDGYILYVSDDGDLRKGSDTINNVGDGQVNANNEEYGLATSDSGQQITQDADCPNSPYNASGITTGTQTAASSSVAVPSGETSTLCYAAAVSSSTINGYYSHIVTYVVTGRF